MPVDANPEVTSGPDEASRPNQRTDALPVNECFYSIQGEGKLAGVPSVFVRTSGCNLRCWFCDSYHTSWEPTHAWLSVDEILEAVRAHEEADHVVVTGGEPMIHDEIEPLIEELAAEGYHVTVETNGTIHRDLPIDLASISPKLASSTPTEERPPAGGDRDSEAELERWTERHEVNRIDLDTLAALVDDYDSQLKFVVTGPDDLPEITDLVERVRETATTTIPDDDVLLMPEGVTRDQLDERRHEVAELAMQYGFRYTPRLHVDLWNDEAGR